LITRTFSIVDQHQISLRVPQYSRLIIIPRKLLIFFLLIFFSRRMSNKLWSFANLLESLSRKRITPESFCPTLNKELGHLKHQRTCEYKLRCACAYYLSSYLNTNSRIMVREIGIPRTTRILNKMKYHSYYITLYKSHNINKK